MISAPNTEAELMTRAEQLAGKTLGELATIYANQVPDNLLIEKGWVGQFCEKLLGASAGSLPEPDFPHLGIELIPVGDTPLVYIPKLLCTQISDGIRFMHIYDNPLFRDRSRNQSEISHFLLVRRTAHHTSVQFSCLQSKNCCATSL